MTRAETSRQTILHPISPGNNDNGGDGSSKSGLLAGIAGAGIASLAIGAIAFLAQSWASSPSTRMLGGTSSTSPRDQSRAKAFITLGGESLLFAPCLQNPHLFKNDLGWCK